MYNRASPGEVNILMENRTFLTNHSITYYGFRSPNHYIFSFINQTKDLKNKFRRSVQTRVKPVWTNRLLKQNEILRIFSESYLNLFG